jgi:acyl-CoA thioester hydrolase
MVHPTECGFRNKREGCTVSLAGLERLRLYHRQFIPEHYMDAMGHMNVRWYLAVFDEASWHFFAALGMDAEYFEKRQLGGFALKHFIRYLAEVRAGESVAVRTRVLARSEKRFQFMHFMINETTGRLAATLEALGTHADMRRRRSSSIPPDIAGNFDRLLFRDRSLDWKAPVCGAIHV